MLTEQEIYYAWRKASGKPFKMPKDWEKKWESFTPGDRETLRKMKRLLATTWQDINIDNYFKCGFEIWKGFWLNKWFRPEVIALYIQKSKNKKRIEENIKQSLVKSAKFVILYCKEEGLQSLLQYGHKREENKLVCVEHYIQDKITKWFLIFLIHKGYCELNFDDLDKVQLDSEKLREMKSELRECTEFTNKLKAKIETVLFS